MPGHNTEQRETDCFFKCERAGRGSAFTKAARADMHFCPFCGEQLSDALPAYLRHDVERRVCTRRKD